MGLITLSDAFIPLLAVTYLMYVDFFGVYLRFAQGCGMVPRNGCGSGWASVPFVLYPPCCRGGWFHTTELFLRGCIVVVVMRMSLL